MAKIHGLFGSALTGSAAKSTFYKSAFDGQTIMRAKAASVKNPNTVAQVINRIITKANGAAYSVLKGIVDHSFEGVTYGARSMQQFLKLNYPILKAVSGKAAFPRKGAFGLAAAPYQVSMGSLPSVRAFTLANDSASVDIVSTAITSVDKITAQEIADLFGAELGDQISFIYLFLGSPRDEFDGMPSAYRIAFNIPLEADAAVVTSGNLDKSLYTEDNTYNGAVIFSVAEGKVTINMMGISERIDGAAIIASRKENGKWLRSTEKMVLGPDVDTLYDTWEAVVQSWSPSSVQYLNQAKA